MATHELQFASTMRPRGGGDGSVQCGKWLQTCMRNTLSHFTLFFRLACSHLLTSHVDMKRTTHCQRFVTAANLDATVGELPAEGAVFQVSLPAEEIHGLHTDSVYDRTSRRGLLSSQRGPGLCPTHCTRSFYMEM